MKVAVANAGIAANPTILAPRGVLEQRRPAASAWPHLGVIPEPFPKGLPPGVWGPPDTNTRR
jgi:hypothetical protein